MLKFNSWEGLYQSLMLRVVLVALDISCLRTSNCTPRNLPSADFAKTKEIRSLVTFGYVNTHPICEAIVDLLINEYDSAASLMRVYKLLDHLMKDSDYNCNPENRGFYVEKEDHYYD